MELVYLYLDKYYLEDDLSICFNPRYEFKHKRVDQDIIVDFKEKKEAVNVFDHIGENKKSPSGEGHITNVTAIVGENGAGKTSLLRAIMSRAQEIYLYIFMDENDMYIYSAQNVVVNGFNREPIYRSFSGMGKVDRVKAIFQSNEFSNVGEIYSVFDLSDISTNGQLREYSSNESGKLDYNSVPVFFNEELSKQIHFICSYEHENIIKFKLPDKLGISARGLSTTRATIIEWAKGRGNKYVDILNDAIAYIEQEERCTENKKSQVEVRNLASAIFIAYLYEMESGPIDGTSKIIYDTIEESIEKVKQEKYEYRFDRVMAFLKNLTQCTQSIRVWAPAERYYNFIKLVDDHIEELFVSPYSILSFKIKEEDKGVSLQTFFYAYKEAARIINFLSFRWRGLSSGENNLLALYARFFHLKKQIEQERIKSLLIFIDEADLSFHPRWQQSYLIDLLGFLKSIYVRCDIQLIITTHSPILLSDMPHDHILYLESGSEGRNIIQKEDKTFGSNIFSLYNNAFFLDKSQSGIIGGLAQYHITNVQNLLKEIMDQCEEGRVDREWAKQQLSYCNEIIHIIGEPIIRKMLEVSYQEVQKRLRSTESEDVDPKKLSRIQKQFSNLSIDEKNQFIEYIIRLNEQGEEQR